MLMISLLLIEDKILCIDIYVYDSYLGKEKRFNQDYPTLTGYASSMR